MGLFKPGKKTRYRRFSYEPRFYDPTKDDRIKKRLQIHRRARKKRPAGLLYFALLLLLAFYIYTRLG